ncbi:MAG: sugar transferase [Dehalococcoidia bacterium]|nr:sugar transferase [Dehalococcoidia bacterium]
MQNFIKRAFDFTLSFLGLVLSSPLWLLISLAIYIEDGCPVLFLQERCGKGGKTFNIIKFRSMRPSKEGKVTHKVIDIEKDSRVTKAGRLLRATAMDELPSLINILKGDMSFVGPKALPFKIEDEDKALYDNITQVPGYEMRSQVRPGLTGMTQVYAPKEISHPEKFQYDSLYVGKMSFWLDLKLIFLSFWVTFRGRWENREKKL